MGVGTPIDLLEAIYRGVDMFDCIIPGAHAQQGLAYTFSGKKDLRRSVYRFDQGPIEEECPCHGCQNLSKSYLHHLVKAKEVTGWSLIAEHNIVFYHRLMARIREAIDQDAFGSCYKDLKGSIGRLDQDYPVTPPKKRRRPLHPTSLGAFEIELGGYGGYAIRHTPSGEVMHGKTHPDEEAESLYAGHPRITELIKEQTARPAVIWDVGLGAAHNAMALIRRLETSSEVHRPFEIYSFENDLNALKLAARWPGKLPHMRHSAPLKMIKNKGWNHRNISWHLVEGCFETSFDAAPAPDVIYYDPFSTHTNGKLWEWQHFKRLRVHCPKSCILITYSSATKVRSSLLASGWFVGAGKPSGTRPETTEATAGSHLPPEQLLGPSWLQRWRRSHEKTPHKLPEDLKRQFIELIENHPQFHE